MNTWATVIVIACALSGKSHPILPNNCDGCSGDVEVVPMGTGLTMTTTITKGTCKAFFGYPVGDMHCVQIAPCTVSTALSWSGVPPGILLTYWTPTGFHRINSNSGTGTDGPYTSTASCDGEAEVYWFSGPSSAAPMAFVTSSDCPFGEEQ